jgi:hypothetical protein
MPGTSFPDEPEIRRRLRGAGIVITNRSTPFVFEQGQYPQAKAFLSLEAGQDLPTRKVEAQRLLASAKDTNNWNYGNVVFEANETLGRVAVKEGNFAEARRCLCAAGKIPGSPQLNSFGPDFVLAHELLAHGAKEDREAVLGFLEDIRRLWGDPATRPEANSRRVAEDHLKELDWWCQEIRDGKIPDDPKWR